METQTEEPTTEETQALRSFGRDGFEKENVTVSQSFYGLVSELGRRQIFT